MNANMTAPKILTMFVTMAMVARSEDFPEDERHKLLGLSLEP